MPSEFRRAVSETFKRIASRDSLWGPSDSGSSKGSPHGDIGQRGFCTFWGRSEGSVEDKYELLEEIGRGAFGIVRKAKDTSTGGMLCCKSINKTALNKEQRDEVEHETEVLLHLRGHPNIVTIMGVFEDADNVHIVAELCSGPSLKQLLEAEGQLSEKDTWQAMKAVLEVVGHCHSMGVLYRDIKPEHFLLSEQGGSAQLKAIDFGISLFLRPDEKHEAVAGTPTYWAPEVFDMEYGYPSDLWSCGVMMYYLLSGEFPFKGRTEPELYRAVRAADLPMDSDAWRKVTEPAKNFIRKLLVPQPAERMTVKEALEHAWLAQRRPSHAALRLRQLTSFRSSPPNLGTLLEASGSNRGEPPHVLLERMRCYSRMTPFKRIVLLQVVRQLEAAGDLAGMRAMFGNIDADKDGFITINEVKEALAQQGATVCEEELQRLVRDVDTNGNGVIDPSEFLAASLNPALLEKKDLLTAAFGHYDLDQDGLISQGDLQALLEMGSISGDERQQIEMMIPYMADRTVSLDEFTELMLDDMPKLQQRSMRRSLSMSVTKSMPALSPLAKLSPTSSPAKDACCVQ